MEGCCQWTDPKKALAITTDWNVLLALTIFHSNNNSGSREGFKGNGNQPPREIHLLTTSTPKGSNLRGGAG